MGGGGPLLTPLRVAPWSSPGSASWHRVSKHWLPGIHGSDGSFAVLQEPPVGFRPDGGDVATLMHHEVDLTRGRYR